MAITWTGKKETAHIISIENGTPDWKRNVTYRVGDKEGKAASNEKFAASLKVGESCEIEFGYQEYEGKKEAWVRSAGTPQKGFGGKGGGYNQKTPADLAAILASVAMKEAGDIYRKERELELEALKAASAITGKPFEWKASCDLSKVSIGAGQLLDVMGDETVKLTKKLEAK